MSITTVLQIVKIDIIYNGRELECSCGAILPPEGAEMDVKEKLREPCSCRGAQGIIVFEEPKAAKVFRGIIKTHKELHRDGQKSEEGVATDRSIQFCEVCCIGNFDWSISINNFY